MATRRRDNPRRFHKSRHAPVVGTLVPPPSPNGAVLEYERILGSARQDVRELLQSEDMRPQREAVLNSGSAVAVQMMLKVAEKRLELISKKMQEHTRQAEMAMGRLVGKINAFNELARELWPRLDVAAKPVIIGKGKFVIRVTARVKAEEQYCLETSEPEEGFPSVELQAQLGLVG